MILYLFFLEEFLKKTNPFRGDADHLSHNLFKKFKKCKYGKFNICLNPNM